MNMILKEAQRNKSRIRAIMKHIIKKPKTQTQRKSEAEKKRYQQ